MFENKDRQRKNHFSFLVSGFSALPLLMLFGFPAVTFGEVIEVDVGVWTDVGTGMTADGWEVSKIERYSDGGAQFKSSTAYALSPVYEDVVTQIVMSVKSSNVKPEKILMIVPTVSKDAPTHDVEPTPDSKNYVIETFWWRVSENVHQVCLQESEGSSGNWGVKSLTVYTDRIEPPKELREDALYRDAFAAGWSPAAKAVRYQVRYASVTRTPAQYETVSSWDFSSLTNTYSGNPRTFDQLKEANPGKLDDLSGVNVCMEANESGHIQIGQRTKLGFLEFPMSSIHEESGTLTGILRAWKHPDDSKCPTMPIYSVTDGVTNDLATLKLTTGNSEYRFQIPGNVALDSIVLSSTTNLMTQETSHGRVRVESFAIVSNYTQASVTTNEFNSVGARTTEKVVKNLTPGEWLWSVRSFDAEDHDSPWSPFRTVILDSHARDYPSKFTILIR